MEEKIEVYSVDIGAETTYDFLNKHLLPVKVGNNVYVKIGTGGAKFGKVIKVKKGNPEKVKGYKSIIEIVGQILEPKILTEVEKENQFQIALGRVFRKQWDSDLSRYKDDWSDILINCQLPNSEIRTGDVFNSDIGEIKIVGFSILNKTSKVKLQTLGEKTIKKKSFFEKLFGK